MFSFNLLNWPAAAVWCSAAVGVCVWRTADVEWLRKCVTRGESRSDRGGSWKSYTGSKRLNFRLFDLLKVSDGGVSVAPPTATHGSAASTSDSNHHSVSVALPVQWKRNVLRLMHSLVWISGGGSWTVVPHFDTGTGSWLRPLYIRPVPHSWLLVLIFPWFQTRTKNKERRVLFTCTPLISLFGMNDYSFFFFFLRVKFKWTKTRSWCLREKVPEPCHPSLPHLPLVAWHLL